MFDCNVMVKVRKKIYTQHAALIIFKHLVDMSGNLIMAFKVP